MLRRLGSLAFAAVVVVLVLVGLTARLADSSTLPRLRAAAPSVIYDRYGTELARLSPASAASSSATSSTAAANSATARSAPASLEAMAPAFVAAATTATQSQNLKTPAPDVLARLWNAVQDEKPAPATQSLAAHYVEIVQFDESLTPAAQPQSLTDRLSTALLVNQVGRDFSAPELLERYLNVAYFGRDAYGASDAAQAWFGTSITDLSVGQAAFLAAWLAADLGVDLGADLGAASAMPADFVGPSVSGGELTGLATEARNVVLFAMYQDAAITADELEAARAQPLSDLVLPYEPPNRVELTVELSVEPSTGTAALGEVVAAVHSELLARYGTRALNLGGLHVVSTIDLPYQLAAAAAVAGVPDSPGQLVVLDDIGGVRAAVGDAFEGRFAQPPELPFSDSAGNIGAGDNDGTGTGIAATRASVLDVAAEFSILANEGELRRPYLVSSVGSVPPGRSVASAAPDIDRRLIERSQAISLNDAQRLTAELMQPFPTQVGPQIVARLSEAAAEPEPDTATSDPDRWLIGWSDQLLVALHTQSAAANGSSTAALGGQAEDQALVAVFADLMGELHYWEPPQ